MEVIANLSEDEGHLLRRALRDLRAVRRFGSVDVDEASLMEILNVARWAGSSTNSQPWRFVVVRESARRQALAGCGKYGGVLADSPVVVMVVQLPGASSFDLGRAAQNLMVAAASLGVASCVADLDPALAREVLGVPRTHGCRWAIGLGSFDAPAFEDQMRRTASWLPRGRVALEELVHREDWRDGP